MKKLNALALIALLTIGSYAHAAPSVDLVATIATYHGGDGKFNDFNPGLIARVKPSGEGLFFFGGAYRNSDVHEASDDYSLTGGIGYEFESVTSWLDVSISAGFATGYTVPSASGGYVKSALPIITPSVTIKDVVVLSLVPVKTLDGSITAGVNMAAKLYTWQ